MEISILEIYGEHPHSLIRNLLMVWAVSILNLFVDKKVFRSLRFITGLRSPVFFGNQKNSAVGAWSIDVVDSFQSTLVHHLLNFCVDLKMFAVHVELRL